MRIGIKKRSGDIYPTNCFSPPLKIKNFDRFRKQVIDHLDAYKKSV